MERRPEDSGAGPAVPVGGGVPIDPETGERFGYLPRKAARRKIIIRRKLGLPWVLGALGAALLIAGAGTAFFVSNPGRPDKRYADEGALASYPGGAVTPLLSGTGWVDRRSALTVWLTREPFCEADGGWGAGPTRWDREGRVVHSGDNLPFAQAQVSKDRLYVDPAASERASGGATAALPSCPGARSVGR